MINRLKSVSTRIIVRYMIKAKQGKLLQKALNSMGARLTEDGDVGNITISAIKRVNNRELHVILERWLFVTKPSKNKKPWIMIAEKELGTKEIQGKGSNKRVEQYHDTVGIAWAKDNVPWCGSFVGFVMSKAGYDIPRYAYRALSWLKFGKSVSTPIMGAIAVKKRKGGGHVTFVVGKSKNEKYLYCLGGNQNDAVTVRRYRMTVFVDFRVPSDYSGKTQLPIMTGRGGNTIES